MSAPVLVLVDQQAGRPRGTAAELLTLARGLGPVHAVWFGNPAGEVLDVLAAYGAAVVHQVEATDPRAGLPRSQAATLAMLRDEVDAATVLLASTFAGKEVAAHLALAIDAGLVVDATGIEPGPSGPVWLQRAFAATWLLRSEVLRPVAVVALSANAVRAEPVPDPVVPQLLATDAVVVEDQVQVLERRERPPTERPALAEADVVVVGGRGTGGDFGPVTDLADALDAAVGATRDATDEGWIDHSAMIGQTGTTIAPRLYVGAGVSGAVHHRGGMMAAQYVVAVNDDPDAPIFEFADVGVVGDLFAVLPQAAAEIRRLRGRA